MNNKSFTLIELLVVIVIIGILAGVIMISTSSSIDKANIAKLKVFDNSVRNSLITNLISEWTFDAGTTTSGNAQSTDVKDEWGELQGTINGTPQIVSENSCIIGKCLNFNGTTDYISYGDKENLSFSNSIFTFSLWIKPSDKTTNIGVLGKRGIPWEYSVHTISSNLYFYAWNSTGSSVSGISTTNYDTNWDYFVWTADGTKYYVYKNGLLLTSNNKSVNDMSDTSASFEIGRGGDGSGTRYMKGLIDEVKVYNNYLSQAQIKQNYIAGLDFLLSNGNISKKDHNQRINELAYEK
ncbi:MAG: LamG-like jellyroll fold domain-containing protein [Bacilli bacterium]